MAPGISALPAFGHHGQDDYFSGGDATDPPKYRAMEVDSGFPSVPGF
jgi:hypothetical protein